jgi:hypothetical protein
MRSWLAEQNRIRVLGVMELSGIVWAENNASLPTVFLTALRILRFVVR